MSGRGGNVAGASTCVDGLVSVDSGATDGELARAACGGARAAFTALVSRHQRRLYRFLRMRTDNADDAEELLQDVLLRSWTKLHQFDVNRPFSSWLYTVAARMAVSRARAPRLPAATEGEVAGLCGGGDPAASAERSEERHNLWDVAGRVLVPEARAALWLFYAEGMSAGEIGAVLDKRADAIRAMLRRARERMAAHLSRPVPCGEEG